jgi:hypothetical protein
MGRLEVPVTYSDGTTRDDLPPSALGSAAAEASNLGVPTTPHRWPSLNRRHRNAVTVVDLVPTRSGCTPEKQNPEARHVPKILRTQILEHLLWANGIHGFQEGRRDIHVGEELVTRCRCSR